jgi:SAM-dependent methyltransferase
VKGFPGSQRSLDPDLSRFERIYVRLLGAPQNGLRIRLRHVLPQTRGSFPRILDAGCGAGIFAMEAAKLHPEAEVVGVDIEADLVDRANAIAKGGGITNCRFELGDVTDLPFDSEFDLVLSVDNLEHIANDVTAMRTLRKALRPGGTLVLHTPAFYRRWVLFKKRVNFDVPGHERPGYLEEELLSKLETAGFEVLSHRFTYGVIENFTNNVSYMISGADQRNKKLYALVFPILLFVSWFGKFSRPSWGAGLLVKARRPS